MHEFKRITGAILFTMFIVYMVITVKDALKAMPVGNQLNNNGYGEKKDASANKNETTEGESLPKLIFFLVAGAVLIAFGADLLVDNGTLIAAALGVPESVIALTFVALGTSLPELVTAITSLVKGHGALSLGNVCGANLFNLVLVSGVSILLGPFSIPAEKTISLGGKDVIASLVLDIPIMLAVMLILTVPALLRGKLTRVQGYILLAIYFGFTIFQLAG